MAFPVRPIEPPAIIAGQSNGKLPLSILVSTPGRAGGPTVVLVGSPTRSWRAMDAAAAADGIILQTTSPADSYRPYAVQKVIFAERYTPVPHEGWNTRTCNGITYWQRPGTATAACPGTSNHGWALAVDIADCAGKRLDWLLAHAARYGWSWELQSEPWHLHYFAGDDIPAAVLAYEARANRKEDTMRFTFDATVPGTPADLVGRVHVTDGLRYRVIGKSSDINKLMDAASGGPIVGVAKANLPDGGTYTVAVAALCGKSDPGEQVGGEGSTADIEAAAERGAKAAIAGATVNSTIQPAP